MELLGSRTQSEVRELLGWADVLLLPSLSEGISNAVLEGMASGLPVVATRSGGMDEVSEALRVELQARFAKAGVRVVDARLTHLAYAAEIAAFIDAMGGKVKASPSGEDGLLALALAEAALKSVAEGRVVKMSEVL